MNDAVATVIGIERSDDMDGVRRAVRAFAHGLGYDRFVLYSASADSRDVIDHLYWLEGDWFGDGSAVDVETYLSRCPVTRHILETDEPFFWSKIGTTGEESYRVVSSPRGTGIHGFQVPIFGPGGLCGAMSFGGRRIESSTEIRLALTLVGTAALRAAKRLSLIETRTAAPQLSVRELEVIRWVASGRKQSDIALTLGLSERTIENHLRRIRKRLGAKSTAQAVFIAMQDE